VDNADPLETILGNKIAHAVAGMNRKEEKSIVSALRAEYERQLNEPPAGKIFPEYFNMKDGTPTRECLEHCLKMRQTIKD